MAAKKDQLREFILVHGAWHGSWCWENVAPALRDLGHTVHTPDLPGAAGEDIPAQRITLKRYVDAVAAVVETCAQPPIVVGHSMAGMVITQLAEDMPERIAALGYLSAFLPRDGESLADLANQDSDSVVTQHRQIDSDAGVMPVMPREALKAAFYAMCDDATIDRIVPRLHAEPIAPSAAPVSTSIARFGRVPRTYIECSLDRAITLRLQRMMNSNTPCPQYLRLPSDHSPFYSMPGKLVEALTEISTVGYAK